MDKGAWWDLHEETAILKTPSLPFFRKRVNPDQSAVWKRRI